MKIAIDFDGTLVSDDRPYDDITSPIVLLPGARKAVLTLRDAGHILILYSGRANLSIRKDWRYDPYKSHLVASGQATNEDIERWIQNYSLNEKRYLQMLSFVERELKDVFTWIDDGCQGKISADLFIDDRALTFISHRADSWARIAELYGHQ